MFLFYGIDYELLSQTEWKKLSDESKLHMLQQIENNIAVIQNRNPRTLIHKKIKQDVNGAYYFKEPERLYIYKMDNVEKAIETIIHEGTHALIDDAVLGRKDTIFLVSKINADMLSDHISSRGIIYDHFTRLGRKSVEFNVLYYEEQLARYESYIHLINGIFCIPDRYMSIKNELLNNVIFSAAIYYTGCHKIEKQYGKYSEGVEKISFDNYNDYFGKVKPFKIECLNMSKIEEYFNKTMKDIIIKSGFDENIRTYPDELPDVITKIKQAKKKKRENDLIKDEYEQLSDETKFVIKQILYYQYNIEQIQNIAIKIFIYPVFAEEIEKMGSDSKLYGFFHGTENGWTGFNIIENIKYSMKWRVEDADLYQRIINYYEKRREEIEQYTSYLPFILALSHFSELREKFDEMGIKDLYKILGLEKHIESTFVPNEYKSLKQQLGIDSTNPDEITPQTITKCFLNTQGSEVLIDFTEYLKQQYSSNNDYHPSKPRKIV